MKNLVTDKLTTACVESLLKMAQKSNISYEELLGEGAAVVPSQEASFAVIESDIHPEGALTSNENCTEIATSLKSDVFLFIIEILPKDIALQEMILNSDSSGVSGRVAYLFLRKFKDARRTAPRETSYDDNSSHEDRSAVKWFNPYHFYFRHMRQMLQLAGQAGEIAYKTVDIPNRMRPDGRRPENKTIPYYSCIIDSNQKILPHSCTGMSYRRWPCPDIDWQKMDRKPYMLETARFFQDEIKNEIGDYYFLPVRELVNFIEVKFPLLFLRETTESNFTIDPDGDAEPFSIEALFPGKYTESTYFENQDVGLLKNGIEQIASTCCSELSDDEKLLLVMAKNGARLEGMAAQLGYKSPSSAKNVLDRAYETVKRHWTLWGPSREDGPELMRYYFKTVIETCASECHIYESEASSVVSEEL